MQLIKTVRLYFVRECSQLIVAGHGEPNLAKPGLSAQILRRVCVREPAAQPLHRLDQDAWLQARGTRGNEQGRGGDRVDHQVPGCVHRPPRVSLLARPAIGLQLEHGEGEAVYEGGAQ